MATTNYPDGVTNELDYKTLGSYVAPDPTRVFEFFDDFYRFQAADWTVTEDETAAFSIADVAGGALSIVLDGADDDHVYVQALGEPITLAQANKKAWFKSRFSLDVVDQSDLFVGLYVTDTDPVGGIVDGIYFHKADGAATLNLVIVKDSTATTTAITTMVASTFVEVGWAYNGVDKLDVFLNGERVASPAITNLPNDELLTPSFAVQNGDAAAVTLLLDYILASYER
jgi:hypothetical protein